MMPSQRKPAKMRKVPANIDEDKNYFDDQELEFSDGGTSSFDDMTSYEKADLKVDRVANELPESLSEVSALCLD